MGPYEILSPLGAGGIGEVPGAGHAAGSVGGRQGAAGGACGGAARFVPQDRVGLEAMNKVRIARAGRFYQYRYERGRS
jgi:hypothetical protein